MSPLQQIMGTGLLLVGLYGITRFYWLRVASCAALLGLWGLAVIVGPIYLAYDDIAAGRQFGAIFTLAISVPMAGCWYIGFDAARKWVADEIRYGRWGNLPWNAQ